MKNGSELKLSGLIWDIAELLRGDYKPSEYGRAFLPLVILRRFDCVLEPTKQAVLDEAARLAGHVTNVGPILARVAGQTFYNTSKLDFEKLLGDPDNIATNLRAYIAGFNEGAAEVVAKFGFDEQITKMERAGLLYKVIGELAKVDLHPDRVSNHQMGTVFEDLIRRFSEQSNETSGDHFTPREVIRLMVDILFAEDAEALLVPGTVRTLYDPTCGTGGMLSVAEERLAELNAQARLEVFGQELNDESYAICRADMMLKGQDPSHIVHDNTLTKDGFKRERFDYCLSNPPFGVDWRKAEKEVREEHAREEAGRFAAGLPRISDGQFLFLQHMISKMKAPDDGGTRIGIVFNSSTLMTGDAGSGESEIRRWIIEHDWLEAVIALPNQLFYNTPLFTYVWIVTNRKSGKRRGKVQLIDARSLFEKMPKSLGDKRYYLTENHITTITELYRAFEENGRCRIFDNEDFGYRRVVVERPLRVRYEITENAIARFLASKACAEGDGHIDRVVRALRAVDGVSSHDLAEVQAQVREKLTEPRRLPPAIEKALWQALVVHDETAPPVFDAKGRTVPDPDLRDAEQIPLKDDVDAFLEAEVLPFAPDAWVDSSKTKIGCEIPFTQIFYQFTPLRPLAEVDEEIRQVEEEIVAMLERVTR